MTFRIIKGRYAVCRLTPENDVGPLSGSQFYSVTRTPDELSIVSEDAFAPADAKVESGWSLFRVEGELDFSLVGILAEITRILSETRVSVFAISTFNTDYLLVKDLSSAVAALRAGGHEVV